jgi:integrase
MERTTSTLPKWQQEIKERLSRYCGKGWTVSENKNGTRLRVTKDKQPKNYQLQIEFGAHNTDAIVERVQQIYDLVESGDHDVRSALAELDRSKNRATSVAAGINWDQILVEYKPYAQTNGTKISDTTWVEYLRDLEVAIQLLKSKRPPANTFELVDRTQTERGLKDKTKARNDCIVHLNRFMTFGHRHHHLPNCWAPLDADDKSELKADSWEAEKSITLSDRQMLELVDSIKNPEWQNVVMMLAAFGLRPFELHHLSVRVNDEGEEQLWCSYEKKAGKGKTKPRFLTAIYPYDEDGKPANWNLVFRFKEGLLTFPPLGDMSAVNRYLSRDCRVFREWRKEAQANKQKLSPYCFRHSYSARGHNKRMPAGIMADLMGHSLQTHCREYRYTETTTTQSLIRALLNA